ncbi:hypothetical protein BGZ47_001780 [Haplosporangium gracile]|nr:hypothetical protein BGZ47_001780 [Haplosporangium gracile]
MSPPAVNESKHALHTKKSSGEISMLLAETDNAEIHFTLTYFELASVGSTARELLEYAGVNHTKNTVTDLHLSESIVVDTFLAERFGLMGDNAWEANLIRMFYINMQYLRERTFTVAFAEPMEQRVKNRAWFLDNILKKFLQDHEYHLKNNGSNGHYVGDKVSLADIHIWNIVHFFGTVPWGQKVIDEFKRHSLVWKVKETVDGISQLAKWRASEEFKATERHSIADYSDTGLDGEDAVAPLAVV